VVVSVGNDNDGGVDGGGVGATSEVLVMVELFEGTFGFDCNDNVVISEAGVVVARKGTRKRDMNE
jgi:hypothetical protein